MRAGGSLTGQAVPLRPQRIRSDSVEGAVTSGKGEGASLLSESI
jgi:hypothetical protein